MPRKSTVKTSYRKAKTTPSGRSPRTHPSFFPVLKTPHGLSPLARYVEENSESGISVWELIEQFQEFDCNHERELETGRSPRKSSYSCPDCGRVRTEEKK